MGAACVFDLNRKELSVLSCTGGGAPARLTAYSGRNQGRDNPDAVALPEVGPIPKGTYYIVDRQAGGRLGWLHDLWGRYGWGSSDHTQWFMLWNPSTGDTTIVDNVRRGSFRLHPEGRMRLSEGCITVTDLSGFQQLAEALRRNGPDIAVPGTNMKAYGTVEVK